MTTAAEIKMLYTNLEAAELVYGNAYADYANDDENENFEIIFNNAEKDLIEAEQSFINALIDFTENELSRLDVRSMLIHKRTELDMWIRSLAA